MLKKLGNLMNESHYSCSVLYECRYVLLRALDVWKQTPMLNLFFSEKLYQCAMSVLS